MQPFQKRKKHIFKVAFPTVLALIGVSCHAALTPLYTSTTAPQADLTGTSTREVRALLLHQGALWAATAGGVLQRSPDGAWQKFTTRDGLPTQEVSGLRVDDKGTLIAQTPRGEARFDNDKWIALPNAKTPKRNTKITAQAQWRQVALEATLAGLRFKKLDLKENQQGVSQGENAFADRAKGKEQSATQTDPQVQVLALPGGVGTHISAMLPRENDVVVALFGDGLWLTDGKKWQAAPAAWQVPAEATEFTALVGDKFPTWLGTRRDGIWHYQNGAWRQHLPGNEPFDHNAQAMQIFKESLFVSTLEEGLMVRSGEGWQQVGLNFLSTVAPRQMAQWNECLWVRHGDGQVDQCDGFAWKKDVFPTLPRRKTLALAADEQRLYLGQWGGWSEWDGKEFTHHLNLPELQGLPPMTLLPDGSKIWFATQSRGLAEVERATGKVRWHDERHGLPDDWITCLLKVNDEIWAGTFVGGLARWDGQKWHPIAETEGDNITSLAEDGNGGLFIATRRGVWHRSTQGTMVSLHKSNTWLEPEAQALCTQENGLWIGTRTGLFYLRAPSVKL